MKQSNRELQPVVVVVGRDSSSSSSSSDSSPSGLRSDSDFAFAFNNSNFSDRDLRIEILPDFPYYKHDADAFSSISDWARNRKRRRDDLRKDEATVEQILSCHMPDSDDAAAYENQDLEPVAMIEESPPVDGVDPGRPDDKAGEPSNVDALAGDEELAMDCSTVLRVETLHISSLLLAAKSPFFYKLFSNGMRESDQRHVTLRIHASEEAAFIDLLNFMYGRTLSASTPAALLDVLMAADKFEVASCMRHCSKLLRNLPMTCESALLYLDLPSTVLMAEAVQPLTDAAKQFLATHYKDISKFQEEVLNLPLAGIEAVLSSDDLQVASEDAVYDFVLKWARIHYPKLEDRRGILGSRLGRLIRFPYMTCRKLKKVLSCNDFDPDLTTKVVLEALFFKAETPYRQRSLTAEEASGSHRRFVERAYKYRPVKVVEFEVPHQQCIVYLDLKREECGHLFPSGRVYSQAFHLGGQGFFLSAHCNMDQQSSFHCFGLFLGMQEKGSVSFAVEYEFAARSKPSDDYVSKYKGNYTFTGGKAVGYRNLFGIPWTTFMGDESPCFINGILHLRAELTIRS
ncbi:hypothetical protein MLD38_038614 [Melastoma candidum]|uniref:Uncharacterized protein n=1 Tax=Melastoma candidum TaxID=119954 RepID=A0ACB9L0Q7_9MYRT|nr:hypothetical protein MLD38_038614 [Melastoma candidum]